MFTFKMTWLTFFCKVLAVITNEFWLSKYWFFRQCMSRKFPAQECRNSLRKNKTMAVWRYKREQQKSCYRYYNIVPGQLLLQTLTQKRLLWDQLCPNMLLTYHFAVDSLGSTVSPWKLISAFLSFLVLTLLDIIRTKKTLNKILLSFVATVWDFSC